jgi:cytochrome c oxidase cbb3-type subunit 3
MSSLFNVNITKKVAVFSALLTIAFATRAQGAAAPSGGNANLLEILLIAAAIVLLFVIWGMGQVLLILGKKLNAKKKQLAKLGSLMILFGLFTLTSTAQTADPVPVAANASANYGGIAALEFWSLAAVIGIEFLVILFLAFMGRRMYLELTGAADASLAKMDGAAHEASSFSVWWKQLDEKFFTRAVPVEKEADVLLDHDYDGIKELDNALPPWWKYGFYITIVVAFIYVANFHVFGIGKNPEQEYASEMEEGKRVEEAYKAKTKNLVDENNLVISDAAGIADGAKVFAQSCIACHGAKGEGGIGPNLTDDYWIHGAAITDVYKTIKLGYPDKGMQSWESMFSPVQIKNLSSFVLSLKGTNPPNAKAPQGDLVK